MVFKHNKRPFTGDEPYQFSYKHSRRVNCGSQLDSFVDTSPFRSISEKPNTSEILDHPQGAERSVGDSITELLLTAEKNFESKGAAVIPDDHFTNASGRTSRSSWVTSSIDEDAVRSECCKHPFKNDESYRHACNHAGQADCGGLLASSVEVLPFSDVPENSYYSDGEGEKVLRQSRGEEKLSCDTINELSVAAFNDPTGNAPVSISTLSWVTGTTGEDVFRSELPIRISFSPHCTENDHRTSAVIQAEDIYSSVFGYLPRKLVAVGPDHQADVPVWSPRGIRSSGKSDASSAFYPVTNEDNSEKFMGTCIIPMPDAAAAAIEDVGIGHRTDCSCPDEGSIRCVRQHVMDAREKLKKTLGHDRFVELGFCDMGEDVAKRWSEEDEQVFHEVVFANPMSLGKNFWDHLSEVFPSRSIKELISYYFNIFMLRKRAEQNRADPSNVDSDNDEWQGSDDGEFVLEGYEEDSVVESATDYEDAYNNDDSHEEDWHEEDEDGDADDDYDDDCAIAGEDNEEGLYDVSKGCFDNKHVPLVQHLGNNLQDGMEDHDLQDDSCTSYEGQHHGADSNGGPADVAATTNSGVEKKLQGEYRNDGISSVTEPLYIVGPCDSKAWDLSYFPGPEKCIDFLPTCNVIEEVFGKGAWDNEARDGQPTS